jgi:hypothetical protein
MATWEITNYYKKNAVERQIWTRDDVVIVKEEGYRWGTWTCELDSQPDIDLDNDEGYEVGFSDVEWEMQDMVDGCWVDWTFPEDMSEEEQERIQALWEESWYEGMESDGWSNTDTEHWIYGPLKLTNLDTGESWHGGE